MFRMFRRFGTKKPARSEQAPWPTATSVPIKPAAPGAPAALNEPAAPDELAAPDGSAAPTPRPAPATPKEPAASARPPRLTLLLSAAVGSVGEAFAELRHHKLRVLLSLIGITVSVAALATVTALSDYQRQQQAEDSDRNGGRRATLSVGIFSDGSIPVDGFAADALFQRVAERFEFSHVSRVVDLTTQVQTPDWVRPLPVQLVDVAYGSIHRSPLIEGRWFRDADLELLAPPVIVSEPFWRQVLGSAPISSHPTITLYGDLAGTYQVIGVSPSQWSGDDQESIKVLFDSFRDRADALPDDAFLSWRIWVPEQSVAEVGAALAAGLRTGVGSGMTVTVDRTDWGSQPEFLQGVAAAEIILIAIASLILLLGGLGLVNIQLVAMRQRIREIGIRRSFGATAGRIFTSVLLESVVAAVVAGVIGIVLAIVIFRFLPINDLFPGLQDAPPFPLRAALIGLIASVLVGALAGFLPALTATRVKVIDALRF